MMDIQKGQVGTWQFTLQASDASVWEVLDTLRLVFQMAPEITADKRGRFKVFNITYRKHTYYNGLWDWLCERVETVGLVPIFIRQDQPREHTGDFTIEIDLRKHERIKK